MMNSTLTIQLAHRGMTMSDLARAIGVHRSTVTRWAKGWRVPALRAIEIERATGIPRADIRPDIFGQEARRSPTPVHEGAAA